MPEKIKLPGNNPETLKEKRELPNPLNEIEASVGEQTDEVGDVDEFEMNQAEKTETLKEYPVQDDYDGPEPKRFHDEQESK
ncbi:MAG TPA: hypothetical protein GX703_00890 [Erysipelothrix sp.]|jgi:hypothetical protein|nr:hypothetical protein [Erysipelothrix sp.]